ncbi:hypothetical protein DSO57_1019534 [Entomophthora muscae]|uniref:Uncharacterized protein n=1 Tax=Entomophthora muscae TaxID=34485 RepID=A0ACC2UPV4_9FUNG|nr:hypothetical protein DSO57_1019534 [Entomophthora muscae]
MVRTLGLVLLAYGVAVAMPARDTYGDLIPSDTAMRGDDVSRDLVPSDNAKRGDDVSRDAEYQGQKGKSGRRRVVRVVEEENYSSNSRNREPSHNMDHGEGSDSKSKDGDNPPPPPPPELVHVDSEYRDVNNGLMGLMGLIPSLRLAMPGFNLGVGAPGDEPGSRKPPGINLRIGM